MAALRVAAGDREARLAAAFVVAACLGSAYATRAGSGGMGAGGGVSRGAHGVQRLVPTPVQPVHEMPTAAALSAGLLPSGTEHAPLAFQAQEPEIAKSMWEVVGDIVGGTGASVSPTGNTRLDQAILRRMRYQDKAVMILLVGAYLGSLLFSASLAYRQAQNDSPVTYYADPRFQDLFYDGHDLEGFLETFNQPPKECHLKVTGLMPLPPLPEHYVESVVEWLGSRYRVSFSFALDLTPWMTRVGSENMEPPALAGIDPDDLEKLSRCLATDRNDLACVIIEKVIEWKNWEELATNIKSTLRQAGFAGVVCVAHGDRDAFNVYKNRAWANFMHSQSLKVLCALSLFGWFLYSPYMWLRQRSIKVSCRYRVDMPIGDYWAIIRDKLGPNGFDAEPVAAAVAPQQRQRQG